MRNFLKWFLITLLGVRMLMETWHTLTNLTDQQVVTETHMDDIRENIEHTGSMMAYGTALSALAASSEMGGTSGTYTGDGGATKAITGLGFQPKAVLIIPQASSVTGVRWKTNQDGTKSFNMSNAYNDDHIISLDANGFTVGDGTGSSNECNVSARVYTYFAWGSG